MWNFEFCVCFVYVIAASIPLYPTMLFSILVYLFYYTTYMILLAIAGLWCFEECALTEDEEYEFYHQHRAMPY